jgi:ABC-type Fe3+ transport system permease subunit
MIILKSLAAGLLAVLAMAIVITILAIAALLVLSARNHVEDTSIGWDPVAFGRAPLPWIILMLVFAILLAVPQACRVLGSAIHQCPTTVAICADIQAYRNTFQYSSSALVATGWF